MNDEDVIVDSIEHSESIDDEGKRKSGKSKE